jgi:hypothetical protein
MLSDCQAVREAWFFKLEEPLTSGHAWSARYAVSGEAQYRNNFLVGWSSSLDGFLSCPLTPVVLAERILILS